MNLKIFGVSSGKAEVSSVSRWQRYTINRMYFPISRKSRVLQLPEDLKITMPFEHKSPLVFTRETSFKYLIIEKVYLFLLMNNCTPNCLPDPLVFTLTCFLDEDRCIYNHRAWFFL